MTIDKNAQKCTFYSVGSEIYDVTELQTYKLIEKSVDEVSHLY